MKHPWRIFMTHVSMALFLTLSAAAVAQITPKEKVAPPSALKAPTIQDYLDQRYEKVGRQWALRARTRLGLHFWRKKVAKKIERLLGLDTMRKAPLAPRVTETLDLGDSIRQRVEIQTEPGIIMPFHVLIPKQGRPPYPAVLALHGHGGGGKAAVVGDRSVPGMDVIVKTYNYDYGRQLVQEGFITFCPDVRGMGERQMPGPVFNIMGCECAAIQGKANPLGQTIAGMWTWDNMRLIDYIQTREDCRKGGVGAAGLSGGGLQTLYLAALDPRVKCAVISGYFWTVKDSILQYGCCPCNFIPRLWEYVDMGDVGALIAPRPLLVESGASDPLNGRGGIESARKQVAITRQAYRIDGAEDRLAQDVFDGGHMWHGAKAIPWLKQWLKEE